MFRDSSRYPRSYPIFMLRVFAVVGLAPGDTPAFPQPGGRIVWDLIIDHVEPPSEN
jgi:hypothetical protein